MSAMLAFKSALATLRQGPMGRTAVATTAGLPRPSTGLATQGMYARSFSISPIVAGVRTPRPKKRIVREQKVQALRDKAKAGSSASRPWTKLDSPLTTLAMSSRKPVGAKGRLGNNNNSNNNNSTGSGSGSGSGGRASSFGPPGNRRSTTATTTRRTTSISVTSLQPGSRSPQYEHVFTPGTAGRALPRSNRPLVRTGNAGRDKAMAAEKQLQQAGAVRRSSGPKVRGFVPARFALQEIESDVKVKATNMTGRHHPSSSSSSSSSLPAQAPRHATSIDNEPVFAETSQESAEELAKRVGEVRFETMGLHPVVQKAVLEILTKTAPSMRGLQAQAGEEEGGDGHYSLIRPTEIQALAIPAAIDPRRKSPYTLCAAQTGSGKTLAYLIPVLHDLKTQEDAAFMAYLGQQQQQETSSSSSLESGVLSDEELQRRALSSVRPFYQPRAIVLLPSRELVLQVSDILKQLSHMVKLRTLTIAHPMKPRDVLMRLNQGPVDIVVATPASLTDYLAKEPKDRSQQQHPFIHTPSEKERKMGGAAATLAKESQSLMTLENLQHLVVDEADTMFDRGFEEDVTMIVKMAQAATKDKNRRAKMTVVSATLPKKIAEHLERLMPNLLKITTPSLHKSLPGLHQTFLDLKPYFGDRRKALLDILANQQRSKSHRRDNTLVFCNTKHSCELLFQGLQEKNVPGLVGVLHGDTKARAELLSEFTSPLSVHSTTPLVSFPERKKSGQGAAKELAPAVGKILISTDIASRGIDTTMVQHVILYDFPTTIVDYLHRVGRTARGGLGGRATSLVGRKDRNLAERIMLGIRYGKVLS